MISSDDAAAGRTGAPAVEFDRKILVLDGGGLRGGGEGQGVNGGEDRIDGRKQVHLDLVWCKMRRLEDSCVEETVEVSVGKPALFPPDIYTPETENYSVYPGLGVERAGW